ncbi:hypothetical protein BJ978_002493 [Agromyces terreus]|uniref:VWFA domain-containing protein n=1 Tax=Agromyces terreus TaxID=424795 RepID=A0A9X2KFJ1_9MICO|nr:substrate-binding domain-containing protein [Agromyces terreus]MCP2371817.1 hypothetical protein [Agromyces terreus]
MLGISASITVLAVVFVLGFVWIGSAVEAEPHATRVACDENQVDPIRVVADPSIAGAVEYTASRLPVATNSGRCLVAEVVAQSSSDSVASIASGQFDADVWIPGSGVWLERLAALTGSLGQSMPAIEDHGSLAVSPVVLGVPEAHAEAIETDPITWARVRDRELPALLPDPQSSAASVAALYAVRNVSSSEDPRQFAAALMTLGKQIPASAEAAIGSAMTADLPTAVILTEVEIAEHNMENPDDRMVAEYPTDGSVLLDYPFVLLPSDDPDDARSSLIGEFEDEIRAAKQPMDVAGLRRVDGSGVLSIAGISPSLPDAEAAYAAAEQTKEIGAAQLDILRLWGIMTLRSRMLAVIDVSGSMEEPAANGLRRIDVFQQAAGGAMSQFSGEVELGVWIFSTTRNGDLDYEELAPIAPLADGAHTDRIMGIIGSLHQRLGGATGFYDTTLAAVERVREGYDPEMVNSVLLITDGKNEDENGIDLPTLLAKLHEQDDPLEPVPVIMVGFGPDTDLAAMQQIAAATGGAAYSAAQPEDLSAVLVDALYQRGCRPDC